MKILQNIAKRQKMKTFDKKEKPNEKHLAFA